MNTNHCHFELSDSPQSLAEDLTEYFSANPKLKRQDDLISPEAKHFFRSHDVVHVIYGCGTSMSDEAVVKLASIFGTTGKVKVLHGYVHHETLDVYRNLPLKSTLLAVIAAPYLATRTIWRCWRQCSPWRWEPSENVMNRSLVELRSQYGIKVSHE